MDILSCTLVAGNLFLGSTTLLFPANGNFFFSLADGVESQRLVVRNEGGLQKAFEVPVEYESDDISEVFEKCATTKN